jgi:hypothetical protein
MFSQMSSYDTGWSRKERASTLLRMDLIGSVSFQNCRNTADKLLTDEPYSVILPVPIICRACLLLKM